MSKKYVSDEEFANVAQISIGKARRLFMTLKGAAYLRLRDGCYVTRKTTAVRCAVKNGIELPLAVEKEWRAMVKESKKTRQG